MLLVAMRKSVAKLRQHVYHEATFAGIRRRVGKPAEDLLLARALNTQICVRRHRAWTLDQREAVERHWPSVSQPVELKITVSLNGPYLVTGGIPLSRQVIHVDGDGNSREWRRTFRSETSSEYALCRCGNSNNKPFCDESHVRVGFDGSEAPTARVPYRNQAKTYEGPERLLTDAKRLCMGARFCDPFGSTKAATV
jgi:CDGSH-type Zn-finger protein